MNFREPDTGEVRGIPLLETVWKISWKVLDGPSLVAHEGEMGRLRPFWPLAAPHIGACSDFPNSFSRHLGE